MEERDGYQILDWCSINCHILKAERHSQISNTTQTPAVAWRLNQSQLDLLDEFEGTPDHYLRMIIPFFARDSPNVIEYCQAYVANHNALGPGTPSMSYRKHLELGYLEYSFGDVPS